MEKENAVWIELERDSSPEVNHKRAKQLSIVLMSLWGIEYEPIWFSDHDKRYCHQTSSGGTYLVLNDNGHWFNLDYLAESAAEKRGAAETI
jgi:hypothetical protein